MELYNNKNYEGCVAELLNKDFSIENNLYMALSLHHLRKYDVAMNYFIVIKSYFENAKDRDYEFYKKMFFYAECLYTNKYYHNCQEVTRTLINNTTKDKKLLIQIAYVLLIASCESDLEKGYPILKEYVDIGINNRIPRFKSHWRNYAEYSEKIGDFHIYSELYKNYDKDCYDYVCLKHNILDNIESSSYSISLLLLCANKKFDEYEENLIKNKDYVNLALFYENYNHEPEKALTFISMEDKYVNKGIKLFFQKKYEEFIKFFEKNYEEIYDIKSVIIYDCTSVNNTTLLNFLYPEQKREKRTFKKSVKFLNIVTFKLIKGLSKMNLNKYSDAIFELEEILPFNDNVKILLAIAQYKNGDFFWTHRKYLKDLPDSGFTKRNLINYYNIIKEKNKVDEITKEYLTQSPNNFTVYYGISANIDIKLFERNKYGVLPIISLLYSSNAFEELTKLVDPQKIKKNNVKVSLLQFINIEINTKYKTPEELCATEKMNFDIFTSLEKNISLLP